MSSSGNRSDAFMNGRGISLPAMKLMRASAGLRLGDPAGERAAIVVLVPLLLLVALWNGFPLIYYDTGGYVLEGLGHHFLVERSPVYSLFLLFTGAGFSLWTIIAIQAIATAFVMVECARVVAPKLGLGPFLALMAGLVMVTGLPWYVGQVEPDCFAAISVLAFYLLAFRTETLGPARSGTLLAVAGFATAAHASHILLVAGLWLSLAVYFAIRYVVRSAARWPKPNLAQPAIMLAIAISLVLASNFYFTRQVFVSRAGPAFLFARLLQDRIVARLLEDTCPGSGYRLCAYKDTLPPSANAWLWTPYSPFVKLGRFDGTQAESERIVRDSLVRYPLWNAQMALADAGRQFVAFKTGDQMEPQQWALRSTFAAYLPSQVASYLSARQQKGQIDFRPVNLVHVPMGYLSLLALIAMLGFAIASSDREASLLLAIVLLALAGNAVICGVLSNPHDRYQSRLIWMAPFAIALVAAAWTARWKQAAGNSAPREASIPAEISEL
jgi:hypothetical protein